MAKIRNAEDWARAQLTDLGIRPNRGNMQIMVGWAKAEGGHWQNDAHHNPLNTTQPMPGAGNTGTQGNIKQYGDWRQGIAATTKTLRNGRYGGILRALEHGDVGSGIAAIGASPWGTGGGLVAQVIRSTPSNLATKPIDIGAGGGGRGGRGGRGSTVDVNRLPDQFGVTSKTTRSLVSPAVDRSAERASLVLNFLSPGSSMMRDPLSFISQARGLADQPAVYSSNTNTLLTRDTGGVNVNVRGGGAGPGADKTSSAGHPRPASGLFELFWQGAGGIDVKHGHVEPQGFVSGHTDHVHVAADRKTVVQMGKLAQQMGLHVGENPHFGGVTPVHVNGSYHYKGEAIDVSGTTALMRRYAHEVARQFGVHHR